MNTKIELAWAAGIFDGEGCVSIGYVSPGPNNALRNPSYRLTVKVTMGCRKTVIRLAKIIGAGTVQSHVGETETMNASTSWVAMARKAQTALRLLRPYLLTKAKEADIGLAFMALPDPARGGAKGSPVMSRRLLRQKHALYVRCCKAKSRFRFRKSPMPTL